MFQFYSENKNNGALNVVHILSSFMSILFEIVELFCRRETKIEKLLMENKTLSAKPNEQEQNSNSEPGRRKFM
jgi:hypothetical protein